MHTSPLVSVVTPVHNAESYLPACIDSVVAQTYTNWEFIIVNNCSTDRTLEIAERYRATDARIKIHNTQDLLSAIENHNFAVSKIDPESRYCKILHADDWLFPECLKQMVEVAESNDSIGVVGSYGLTGCRICGDGLRYPSTVVSGKEICRLTLLGKTYPFYSPSSTMLRTDLVRGRKLFYDPSKLHTDVELMYQVLQQCDFGFVHQVLTYIRRHSESETSKVAKPLDSIIWSNFHLFVRYGPVFLNEDEFSWRLRQYLEKYYKFLANSFWEVRSFEFWRFHYRGLKETGYPLRHLRLLKAILGAAVCRPKETARRLVRRFKPDRPVAR